VLGDAGEIRIGGQQSELVPDAELGEDRVDGSDLKTSSAGSVSELRGVEVILAIWCHEGQRAEARHDSVLVASAAEPLQELLVDEAGRDDEHASCKRSFQSANLGRLGGGIAPKRKGPDARIYEERQLRERSRL
jgi:hypothetical protein